ncbi:MAG TPA: hypothetical protein VJB59_07135 [Bdellovibrionota bacterium]|nr:hypothetical protein [Bdellovibrionota bacterium]
MMNPALVALELYLEDELKDYPDVKVTFRGPSGTRRSPDLEQDYDPSSNDIHLKSGFYVRIGSREYFFPAEWAGQDRSKVDALIAEIRNRHPER